MKAVATCNNWVSRPPALQDLDYPQTRRGVIQWAWRTESNLSLPNNQTRVYICRLMLPLILTDILLHVSNPDPAPIVERVLKRMEHTFSEVHHRLL
jgi:hypothetical protein